MDLICLNKSKTQTIVFIHGFYANAGYWLPYLASFKNYRIVLLNINYNDLLYSNNMIQATNSLFQSIHFGNEVVALISHSLGTVVSNYIDVSLVNNRFEICPVGFSKRSDTAGFVNDIKSRVNQSEKEVVDKLLLVDSLISQSKSHIQNSSSIRYVPTADPYFTYTDMPGNNLSFKGDHFEIDEAIADIASRLDNS
jgi:hypothetical protein